MATKTLTKFIATAPDGTEIKRHSARPYTHAVLVEYRPRENDVIQDPKWGVLSFNSREELALKEAEKWQPYIAKREWANVGHNRQEKFLRTLVVPVTQA